MRIVVVVVRGVLSLTCTLVAGWCIVRGLARLFGIGSTEVASMSGVGPALGYFAAGVVGLLAAGELYPKPAPRAPEQDATYEE